jgi:polysaccharide pyruvyl transferase WcaK-like protein
VISKMRYLIVGVSLRSRGGEAMVFEACKRIRELDSECQILLLSSYKEYDTNFLRAVGNPYDIKVCELLKNGKFFKYFNMIHDFFAIVLLLICRHLNISHTRIPFRTSLLRIYADIDVILEIAGVSFTDNFGIYGAARSALRMICAKLLGKKYFCLPQSYGPSSNLFIRILARIGLDATTYIMPRGVTSIKFLREIGIRNNNVIFVPDLAFSYEDPDEQYRNKVYTRLHISPSNKYVAISPNVHIYRWLGLRILRTMINIIDYLTTHLGYNVFLIAHEIRGNTKMLDDKFICDLLHKKVKNREKVITVPDELTANEIKALIALCDFVITSRYHCMISALKMRVPPIVVAWANKYSEAMELFGLQNFVVNYEDLKEEELINKIALLLHERDIIVKKIEGKISKLKESSQLFKEILRKEMYEKR